MLELKDVLLTLNRTLQGQTGAGGQGGGLAGTPLIDHAKLGESIGKAVKEGMPDLTDLIAVLKANAEAMQAGKQDAKGFELKGWNDGVTQFGTHIQKMEVGIEAFGSHITRFTTSTNTFGTHVSEFAKSVAAIPLKLELAVTGQQEVNMKVEGLDFVKELEPTMKAIATQIAGNMLDTYNKRLKDTGPGLS